MIRTDHRTKGAPVVGASTPGEPGPFGTWPTEADEVSDRLRAEARERVAAQIRAAANKRARSKRRRAAQAAARRGGLTARHADKLARLQEPNREEDQPCP